MNPIVKRRLNDLQKLKELEKKYSFIKIKNTKGDPISEIFIDLHLILPISEKESKDLFELKVKLPSEYPLSRPLISVSPTVFNPHVFESGNICLGNQWMPSIFLDLEVLRVIKLLLLYPEFINPNSPANSNALSWYKKNKKKFPLLKID
jgi:Ubiquitin-protein ligase